MSDAPRLFTRHRPLALSIASGYRLPGGDADDVRQEAMIGLWRAARTYDRSRGSFPAFARLCVTAQLDTAVRTATRRKHRMLTDTVRVVALDDGPADAVSVAVDENADPVELVARRAALRRIVAAVEQLSPLERRAFVGHVFEGRTYAELGGRKAIDNALTRAHRKLRGAA